MAVQTRQYLAILRRQSAGVRFEIGLLRAKPALPERITCPVSLIARLVCLLCLHLVPPSPTQVPPFILVIRMCFGRRSAEVG